MMFKDAAPYFAEAAGSVLAQSWPSLELLLVDDGGTDGTSAMAHELARAHPDRVRVLSHPGRVNRGTGPSRILGLEHVQGELVSFLDADDVWGRDHLARDVALLEAHPDADFVCGRSFEWYTWAGGGRADHLNPLPFAPGAVIEPPRMLRAVLRNGSLVTAPFTMLAPTSLVRSAAPDMVGFPSTYEDQVLANRLQLGSRAVISDATDAWYRRHDTSLTADAERTGHDALDGPSPGRGAYVRWLTSQPELAPDRVDDELREMLEALARSQEGGRVGWALRRRARRALSLLPAPARSVLRRLLRRAPDPDVDLRRDTEAFLASWAEDLHGDVAVVGTAAEAAAARARARVRTVQRPASVTAGDLRAVGPVDCLVVTGPLRREQLDELTAVLPSALRPAGALLLAVTGGLEVDTVLARLHGRFEQAHTLAHAHDSGGTALVTARALRPA